MKKVIAYIDGFNFYYRAVKDTPYKWIDFESLIKKLAPGYEILKIRYFTAFVKNNPRSYNRQKFYIEALKANPKIKIHEGLFLFIKKYKKFEEKCTDVNLATYMMYDACKVNYDCALLLSNDLDFKEPIKFIKNKFNKEVIIVNPDREKSIVFGNDKELLKEGYQLRKIREETLKNSQLPNPVILSDGKEIRKPIEW